MIDEYICKIANAEDIEQNWNYLIEIHPDNNAWKIWKEKAITDMTNGNAIVYYGILNGVIISEATAFLSNLDVQNSDGLVDDTTAYLTAFRTNKEYEGKGYFSKLYKFMEEDLKSKGYTVLTLGVEPEEIRNKEIYKHYGFVEHIKNAKEVYPDGTEIDVEYYGKKLK